MPDPQDDKLLLPPASKVRSRTADVDGRVRLRPGAFLLLLVP